MTKVVGIMGETRQCKNCGNLTNIRLGIYINGMWFCKASCHNKYGERHRHLVRQATRLLDPKR